MPRADSPGLEVTPCSSWTAVEDRTIVFDGSRTGWARPSPPRHCSTPPFTLSGAPEPPPPIGRLETSVCDQLGIDDLTVLPVRPD
jgi:hypothetical protein